MIVPLILLDAVLYYVLFKAKAQYALIYVPLMIPYCAYAYVILSKNRSRMNKHHKHNH